MQWQKKYGIEGFWIIVIDGRDVSDSKTWCTYLTNRKISSQFVNWIYVRRSTIICMKKSAFYWLELALGKTVL